MTKKERDLIRARCESTTDGFWKIGKDYGLLCCEITTEDENRAVAAVWVKQSKTVTKDINTDTTVKEWVNMNNLQEFIDYLKEDERSENTIKQYTDTIRLFFAKYNELTNETARDYKIYLVENFKPKTVNCRLTALKKYSECFSISVKIPKKMKLHRQLSVENVITLDEFNTLCNGLKEEGNIRGYWFVMFLAKTGARVSEFVRFPKRALEIGYAEMFTKGKFRRIYIPENLINESKEYFSSIQNDLLFPSRYKKQITSRGVVQLLHNFGERYGIRKEVMHPHGFRHFFAKEFLRKGGDITLLSDLLGHEDLGTTAIYTRHSSEEMAQKLSTVMGAN